MQRETSKNIESAENSSINLDKLSFEFCDNDFMHNFYSSKLKELENYTEWFRNNKKLLGENKEKLAKAVEDGVIENSQPETIWQLQIDRAKASQEKAISLKETFERTVHEIKDEVAKRLSKFLPTWAPEKVKIVFTVNEKADFCIDNGVITVDLDRLLFEQNPIEKVKSGATHEIFHYWMAENSKWSDSKQDKAPDQELKDQIIFRTIDEGLAVLISRQSLEKHHTDRGINFIKHTKESFDSFNDFLLEDNRVDLKKYKAEKLKAMGHFYVVGNEIVKTVAKHVSPENFRKLITESRDNPSIFLQKYKELCDEHIELLKINF